MNQNTFNKIVGVVFLLVALAHLFRVIQGWDVVVGNVLIPTYVSWLGILVAGCLSYYGLARK